MIFNLLFGIIAPSFDAGFANRVYVAEEQSTQTSESPDFDSNNQENSEASNETSPEKKEVDKFFNQNSKLLITFSKFSYDPIEQLLRLPIFATSNEKPPRV
jgi:hypothetical protein